MELNLGPIRLACVSGRNWTHLQAGWVTNRYGGAARRETAISAGFKSEHAIEMAGKDNPADKFTCPDTGKEYFGKLIQTPTGVYVLSAQEVYTKALYTQAVKAGLNAAEAATTRVETVDVQVQEPVAA
jgi:hypothetical protein